MPVRADDRERNNNLNLLRLVAALAVMVSHAWPMVYGAGTPEPWEESTGLTLGTVAVMAFFGLSGFLLAGSWSRRPRPLAFAVRRARRILPGLWAMLLFTTAILGYVAGEFDFRAFLGDPGMWRFLARNATLMPVEPHLPGVFEGNPYPAVAGSIWTLHYEALCYLGLVIAGWLCLLTRRRGALLAALAAIASVGGAGIHPRLDSMLLLGLPFAFGVAAWCWRDRLALSWPIFAGLVGLAALTRGTGLQPVASSLAIVYATLFAGFRPCRWARSWNRAGDYSYGAYLYAFPIQGLVQWGWQPQTPGMHIALSILPVAVAAILSWHLIEARWLAPRHTMGPMLAPGKEPGSL